MRHNVAHIGKSSACYGRGGAPLASALAIIVAGAFFFTAAAGFAQMIATDKVSYQPGEKVLITGEGWEPQDPVLLVIGNTSGTRPTVVIEATAGPDGAFSDGSFIVQEFDADETLIATARAASGAKTMIAFKGGAAPGVVSCSTLNRYDANYGISPWQKVTCTIDGASDLSAKQQAGLEPVEVLVRSKVLGNQPATVLSVSGTLITFEYTAPGNACGSSTVSYGPIRACDSRSGRCTTLPTEGNDAAAGFTYLNADKAVVCDAPKLKLEVSPQNGAFFQGGRVGYRIVVSNPAAVGGAWANNVKLTDELPGKGGLVWHDLIASQGSCVSPVVNNMLDCSLGNIPPQGTVTVMVASADVTPESACQQQRNRDAVATADGGATAYASGSISCTPPPQLRVVTTPDGGTFKQGSYVVYTSVVSNPAPEGSGPAGNVTLTSQLPVNGGLTWSMAMPGTCTLTNNYVSCPLGDIPAGGSSTVKVYSTASTPDAACQYQEMFATAIADGGLEAEDSGSQTCVGTISPQLKVATTPDSGLFQQGGAVTYSIVVSNPSTVSSSTNVQLTDALPSNGGLTWTKVSTTQGACSITNNTLNCGLGTIPPGANVSVTVSTDSVTPPLACTDQPNAAAIATADGGFVVQDGGFQRCIPAQLRVTTTPDKGTFQQGGQVIYTIVVKNPAAAGSSAATDVVLTDDLPANGGLTWASATTTQGSCSIAGNRLSCLLGNLVAGGSATVVVSSPATTPASACQPQPNPGAAAVAYGYLKALDPGSQSCTPPVKIQVVRTEGATLAAAEVVTYRYTVTNTENVGVTDVVVREDNGTPGDPSDDIVVGIIPTLAAGASGTLTWTGPPFKRSGNEIITKLGSAAPGKFTVLSLGGDQDHPNAGINCSNATIDGNVGVASYGKFLNMAPCTETGDFYRGERVTYSGPGKLLGRTIVDEALMNQLRKDAFDAAAHFAGLPATPSVQKQFPSNGSIKGTVTVTGTPGVNVVKLPGLALNGNLILDGPAGTQFVLNISGTFNLHSGNIVTKGGVGAFDVIYNITNPAASVKTMMPTTAIGVLLAPYNTIDAMDSSNFYGTVIGGYNTVIKLWSGTRVVPPAVPPQPANSTATAYGVPVGVTEDPD